MENKKLVYYAVLDAIGTFLYVVLVAWFMSHASQFLGKEDNFMSPVVALLIFIISALVTSSLVLGRPIMYYLDGKKKEALKLFFYTGISLVVLFFMAIGEMLLLK